MKKSVYIIVVYVIVVIRWGKIKCDLRKNI